MKEDTAAVILELADETSAFTLGELITRLRMARNAWHGKKRPTKRPLTEADVVKISRRKLISLLSGVGLVPLQSLYGICARAADGENQDLQKRGQALRVALEQKYQELRRAQMISGIGAPKAFTQLVLQYIPVGTSFDDAETILRHAGFSVRRPNLEGKPDRNSPIDWYGVQANIDPFDKGFLYRASVYVTLLPKVPGEYTTVENVISGLFVMML